VTYYDTPNGEKPQEDGRTVFEAMTYEMVHQIARYHDLLNRAGLPGHLSAQLTVGFQQWYMKTVFIDNE
jgi:hypothetical protein